MPSTAITAPSRPEVIDPTADRGVQGPEACIVPVPFSGSRQFVPLDPGSTIQDILEQLGFDPAGLLYVEIDGLPMQKETWDLARPKPGTRIVICYRPEFGGAAVGVIGALAQGFASGLTLGAFGSLATGVGVGATIAFGVGSIAGGLVLSLGINALIPTPDAPSRGSGRGGSDNERFRIKGTRNSADPFGQVPLVLGTHRITPPLAAQPWTETTGEGQFLRMLFMIGRGPLNMRDMRIGNTPIGQFDDVEIERRRGTGSEPDFRIFPDQVFTDEVGARLTKDEFVQRRTEPDVDEIRVDISFPRGFFRISDNGGRRSITKNFTVQVAEAGTGNWSLDETLTSFSSRDKTHNSVPTGKMIVDEGGSLQKKTAERIDRVVMRQHSGDLIILEGDDPQVLTDERADLILNNSSPRRQDGLVSDPEPPALPNNVYKIARVKVDDSQVVSVEDERQQDLLDNTDTHSDFSPSDGGGFDTTVASGKLKFPITITSRTSNPFRKTIRLNVSRGQYDVRVTRDEEESVGLSVNDQAKFASLKSLKNDNPVSDDIRNNFAMVALRIKATDQINGVIDQFNLIAGSVIKDWDRGRQYWVERESDNPASIYRHVLQHSGNPRALSDSNLDLTGLQDWHEANDDQASHHRVYSSIIRDQRTIFDTLREVSAAGRASFNIIDGKFGVVQDIRRNTPSQHFTARNVSSFEAQRIIQDNPHAIRAKFTNREQDYEPDERVVFDDGFDFSNATKFEEIQFNGVVDPDAAWVLARYHLRVARLRQSKYVVETDMEHLAATRGDLVLFTHDVPQFGVTGARITDIDTSGADPVVTIDEEVTIEKENALATEGGDTLTTEGGITLVTEGGSDKRYTLRIRLDDGSTVTHEVKNSSGTTKSLTLDTINASAKVGDLVMFGEQSSETKEMIVKSIEPQEDLAARMTLVPAKQDQIHGSLGSPPLFESTARLFQQNDNLDIAPRIEGVDIDGQYTSEGVVPIARILLGDIPAVRGDLRPREVQAEFRQTDTDDPWRPAGAPEALPTESVPVNTLQTGETYDFRVRYLSRVENRASRWSTIESVEVNEELLNPGDVSNLRVEDGLLSWDAPSEFFVDKYEVRVFTGIGTFRDWDAATKAHSGFVRNTVFDTSSVHTDSERNTWMIKAVDTEGRKSDRAKTAIFSLSDIENLEWATFDTRDVKSEGFTGEITNASIDGSGNLVADRDNSELHWGRDGSRYWPADDSAKFWQSPIYKPMTYKVEVRPASTPGGNFVRLRTDITFNGTSNLVTYQIGEQSTFWVGEDASNFWDSYDSAHFWPEAEFGEEQAWSGLRQGVRPNVPYRFIFRTDRGPVQGEISTLKFLSQARTMEEKLNNVSIAASGTRLPIQKSFENIQQVGDIAIQGSTGVGVQVIDKDTSGPMIKVVDSDGNGVAATVDATVKGI